LVHLFILSCHCNDGRSPKRYLMKRFYSLSVDRLEDRCVPAEVIDGSVVLTADVSMDPTAGAVVQTTGDTNYVIDVYPVDPTAPTTPSDPIDVTPEPGTSWGDPTQPVPPTDDPFWL
jgi:hypothetical protein